MTTQTRKVVFVSDYTSRSTGEQYEAGKSYTIEASDARVLIRTGKARDAATEEPAPGTIEPAPDAVFDSAVDTAAPAAAKKGK
jgi:hypothetical protein